MTSQPQLVAPADVVWLDSAALRHFLDRNGFQDVGFQHVPNLPGAVFVFVAGAPYRADKALTRLEVSGGQVLPRGKPANMQFVSADELVRISQIVAWRDLKIRRLMVPFISVLWACVYWLWPEFGMPEWWRQR